MSGSVAHIVPGEYRVACYLLVAGGWWSKPYFAEPLTGIDASGAWTCDVTTGGNDRNGTAVAAFLVVSSFSPPLASGSPALPISQNGTTVVAEAFANR